MQIDIQQVQRLVDINHGQARWFIDGAEQITETDARLIVSGLISLEDDGTIAVTPAGLDLLFKLP